MTAELSLKCPSLKMTLASVVSRDRDTLFCVIVEEELEILN